ncbi:hypothetical protein R1sor_011413 [Riccia sorocarpa]|uniref:Uncharacterized protein n=1 Tax=Riccia sorocarpa TaxID=122646 RepID=A0ABD3I0T0_9MARC
MGKWSPELTKLGYDDSLPAPINNAILVTMASIASKNVHSLVQQLDLAAVTANKDIEMSNGDGDGYAALLLESLGIDNWISILHTFMTSGEDATLALVRQLHEDLPTLLETDLEEEGRASELAKMIGKTLCWIDLDKNLLPGEIEATPDVCSVDVPSLVKSNPLICFDVFTNEEQQMLADTLDNLQSSQVDERAEFTDGGDYFIPTDTPRTIEYQTSTSAPTLLLLESRWICRPILAVLQSISRDFGTGTALTYGATANLISAKKPAIIWLDHALWYILNNLTDFFPKKSVKAQFMAFLIFLGSEARDAILAQCTFMFTRQFMIEAACEVFSNPKAKTLIRFGDAAGIRMIERLVKPACFSDNLVSTRIQNSQKKRPRQTGPLNLNSAPTRFVPMGRGRGRNSRPAPPRNYNSPRSGSSSNRSFSSSVSTSFSGRNMIGRGSPMPRRNMALEFGMNP